MHTLKTITLALMLIIFSIVGLRAEEISLQGLFNEGYQAYYTADYPTVVEKWEQGLNLARKVKNQQAIGTFLGNIGSVYEILGNYPKALDYHQRALTINKEIGDKHGQGVNLGNIGNVHLYLGYYPKALDYSQQALKIRKEIRDKRGIGIDLINIGVVYKSLGEYQKSKNALKDSLTIFETIGSDYLWLAQRGLASTEAKLNQPESAIQHYNQALNNIERIRNLLSKEHKTSFMYNKLDVYYELIALLQSQHSVQPQKGYDRKAFETFERKQGRLFLEEMGESGARRFVGLDNKIVQKEQSLIHKWQKLKSKPFTPQERAALEQQEVQLKNRIKKQYPKYYALKYPQPVDLATLQNQVLQKGEMMLVYGVLKASSIENKTTVLWVIGKQDFQMFTLPVDEDSLKQKVAELRAYLSKPSFNRKFPQASLELYQTLLPKDVRKLIKGADMLYRLCNKLPIFSIIA